MDLHLEKHEAALKEARQKLLEQLGECPYRGSGIGMRESVTDLSFADNHPADLGTENFERSKDLSLRESRLTRLRYIEEALARIDGGTYGTCRRCGETISPERLEAVPEAPLCLLCREYEEKAAGKEGRRPVEEELLSPPFARSTGREDLFFDSEDCWQAVAGHNKRPFIYEDILDDKEKGLVEDTDALSNEDLRKQLPD
ncbi:MAG: yteA family sporulation protein [Firmicutes bacterium]|nr:yteA family sporulation protein [Bacillota bacterium]